MKRHASVHTLGAAYALGALDADERREFAAHLRECDACRQEAVEFEATTARLGAAVSRTPPAGLKTTVMSAVDGVRQLPPETPATTTAAGFGVAVRRKAPALALAASVAAVALGGLAVNQTQNAQEYQDRAQQAEQRMDDVSTVLAAPDARTVHGKATNGALATVVVSDTQDRAVFTAGGLPAPAAGKTYQLWLDHDGTMLPAGLIAADGTVPMTGSPADATAVGLTLEPSGGSDTPTSDPLLLMSLPA
ncbi:anti-sigma factor domain-containing protein [Streptomyces sp. NPDC058486]|uniref:anti-sigma factor n=1 Tax=unclassified Streptomyces TaxID=2593676 RepID=UPI00365C3847